MYVLCLRDRICTWSTKNKILQWISIEFLIMTMYYLHLIWLENPIKKVQKFSAFHSVSTPTVYLFKKYFCTLYVFPLQERNGNKSLPQLVFKKIVLLKESNVWQNRPKTAFFLLWPFLNFERKTFKKNWDKQFLLKHWRFRVVVAISDKTEGTCCWWKRVTLLKIYLSEIGRQIRSEKLLFFNTPAVWNCFTNGIKKSLIEEVNITWCLLH